MEKYKLSNFKKRLQLINFLFEVTVDYTEQEIAISEYPLSAALTCTKLCSAFEEAWGIH